eukprot:3788183-Amphidinium_carterae.1
MELSRARRFILKGMIPNSVTSETFENREPNGCTFGFCFPLAIGSLHGAARMPLKHYPMVHREQHMASLRPGNALGRNDPDTENHDICAL